MPGFMDVVSQAWNKASSHTQPIHIVNHKLKLTASRLRSWSKLLFSNSKLLLLMALDVVFQLDVAQEDRPLSPEERGLRSDLKRRILALASLERARKKQSATIAWLKEGDANSKFFHIRANGRRRKNHIQRLLVATAGPAPRSLDLNWAALDLQQHDLDDLDLPFSEEEILKAIVEFPADKAPGPDGFTGNFFRACWPIIKDDIMCLANAFGRQETHNLHICNTANIVLIPKKDGADSISDYRPISLIHAMAKILSKAMALRLRPKMHELVSLSQSAFIKTRSIHDNFMFVRGMARRLDRSKSPTLLIKLDIAKAFDTRVPLNGSPGEAFCHGRDLRQGNPLSPLLFILAIDPLQHILQLATQEGLLSELPGCLASRLRLSLYADDAVIFLSPTAPDVANLSNILQNFGEASGLRTNVAKSSIAPIRYDAAVLDEILAGFPAVRHIIDKAAGRLAIWKGKWLTRAGCLTLVKSVMTSIPIFTLLAIRPSKRVLSDFDKLRRNFLWSGGDKASGRHCKINWQRVCRPKNLGGLGILNLEKFSRALRLRWLWNSWTSPDKPWVGLDLPCDDIDKSLFDASTKITIGNRCTASFWSSAWLDDQRPKDIAPNLFRAARRKNRTVREALTPNQWATDLNLASFTPTHIREFIDLWIRLQNRVLLPDTPDSIVWTLTPNGIYSTSSAYKAQFFSATACNFHRLIWSSWSD
ncbi:uncharacterized protein LOC104581310 [Brachypodium distachyon]|uniref:uncharacterized protein LOC104581310 n=1 Tax=Brachypodium distachyon TaxID=15368 RepID=UPI0005300721|nr:uncharacterized protein LOC104581310 [Brachypodium distachyon]|eukprot:XP_010239490.1 uncharacterized protein LOC104581310 [Brachypodium distachyon]